MKVEFAYEVVAPAELPLVVGGVYVAGQSVVMVATDVDPCKVDPESSCLLVSLSDGNVLMDGNWVLAEEVADFLRSNNYRYVPNAKVFIPAERSE